MHVRLADMKVTCLCFAQAQVADALQQLSLLRSKVAAAENKASAVSAELVMKQMEALEAASAKGAFS